MPGESIALMENRQISARDFGSYRQTRGSTVPFHRPQPRTKLRIRDLTESLLNQQIHENSQIYHNHHIYHSICIIWERLAVGVSSLLPARQNEKLLEELQQSRLPQSLSSAYSERYNFPMSLR